MLNPCQTVYRRRRSIRETTFLMSPQDELR
jgi:hypothetical protein